jgi:hypothetical protein
MAVQLAYGSYFHDANDCSVVISHRTQETDSGLPYEDTFVWNISGVLFGNNTADVVRKLRLMELAYSRNFQDLVLYSSGNIICHELRNAGSTSGVRVTQKPTYPVGNGAELSTFRNYQITLEASYPAAGANSSIKQWSETVRFQGGGPKYDWATMQTGRPVKFEMNEQTVFRAWQSGTSLGYRSEPPVSPPLWPDAMLEAPTITPVAPQLRRGQLVDWQISWSYVFASATPLIGRPRPQPFQ